ncbi:hypothetical protein ACGTJS_10685 [Faucicola mancuniensis]|uniref:hypothetical protein n=1 Tax=Faucicola mancuniensis TaxID=1309795 RepID=UPI003977592A
MRKILSKYGKIKKRHYSINCLKLLVYCGKIQSKVVRIATDWATNEQEVNELINLL